MSYITRCASPLGDITLTSDGQALTGLWLDGQEHHPSPLSACCPEASLPVFDQTRRWLELYFGGVCPPFTPPLAPAGTPFRQAVWALLRAIPYGETTTYGRLARDLARQRGLSAMSAQAVGGAVGHNPISILIPCHRVLGSDGSLTGYDGGLDKKRRLLALEGALPAGEPSPAPLA